ncbi:acyl carrier protein [Gaetbulibacter jejuensis]|uniref:Carrier domain-containing protein n=1 Tax=Gaetbulibacter jejuensis TaxID=584607 RepID=A0ABN1JIR2_9FLAO
METTILRIKKIISEKLDVNCNMDEVTPETSLLEDGIGLDSISIVNFIVMVEKEFDISFSEEDLNMDMFSNLTKICDAIDAKQN